MSDHQHLPAFDQLCDWAEKHGILVGLRTGAWRSGLEGRGRQLVSIELLRPNGTAEGAPVEHDDIEAAALELLARLA